MQALPREIVGRSWKQTLLLKEDSIRWCAAVDIVLFSHGDLSSELVAAAVTPNNLEMSSLHGTALLISGELIDNGVLFSAVPMPLAEALKLNHDDRHN